MRALEVLTVLFLASTTDATTQEQPPPLERGQRVRVTAPALGMNKHEGWFQQLHVDTLVITSDSILDCPLSDVTRLEVPLGRKSNVVGGAAFGFGFGAVFGAVAGVGVGTDMKERGTCSDCTAATAAIGAVTLGVTGALVGALIGGVTKSDKWEEVSLDRLQVTVAPTPNGFGIGARIAY